MKIKITAFFTIFLLLPCFMTAAVACPPPYCGDCYWWHNGGCECRPAHCCSDSDCSPCFYGCEDCTCQPCKCWDTGDPIEKDGGLIVDDEVTLCGEKQFWADYDDYDHWTAGGASEDYPEDLLLFYWYQTLSGNPEYGTWDNSHNYNNINWQAPPCIGSVRIKDVVDDEPDEMDLTCPGTGNTRNDSPTSDEKTTTVILPEGCEHAGPHDTSIHWPHPDDDYPSPTATPFGSFSFDAATYDVDFKYDNCSWVCEISDVNAKTTILVRDPATWPGHVSVSQASDVPCDDALLAKYDLTDNDLFDDHGAPRTKYWSYAATVAHEEKHRSDWKYYYTAPLTIAIVGADSISVEINCSEPTTTNCSSVESAWYNVIKSYFDEAWEDALRAFDDPDTELDEAEMWAYMISASIEGPIAADLPGGCSP